MESRNDSDVAYPTVSGTKIATRGSELEVMLPDTRGVTVSRFGKGNLKLGPNVVTYSRLPGKPQPHGGTCPGATPECISICYAFAINDGSPVWDVYKRNSDTYIVPPLPEGTKFLRWHVSGDFDSTGYISQWITRVHENPDTKFWGYTRAWRVPALLESIERLRALPNVQLFASMDSSDDLLPPEGWRRSWLSNDQRSAYAALEAKRVGGQPGPRVLLGPGVSTLLCPEETSDQPHCEACRYCISGTKGDVTFVVH